MFVDSSLAVAVVAAAAVVAAGEEQREHIELPALVSAFLPQNGNDDGGHLHRMPLATSHLDPSSPFQPVQIVAGTDVLVLTFASVYRCLMTFEVVVAAAVAALSSFADHLPCFQAASFASLPNCLHPYSRFHSIGKEEIRTMMQ